MTYYLDMFLNLLLIFCVHPDFFIFDKERDKKYVMLCLWSKSPPQVQWLTVHDDKVWKIKFAKAPDLKLNKKVYPLSVIKIPIWKWIEDLFPSPNVSAIVHINRHNYLSILEFEGIGYFV